MNNNEKKIARLGMGSLSLNYYQTNVPKENITDPISGERYYSNLNGNILSPDILNRNNIISSYFRQYLINENELTNYELFYYPIPSMEITSPDITGKQYYSTSVYNTGDVIIMKNADNLFDRYECLADSVTGPFDESLWGNKSLLMINLFKDNSIQLNFMKKDIFNTSLMFYIDIVRINKNNPKNQESELFMIPSIRPFKVTFSDNDLISPSIYTTEFINFGLINLDGRINVNEDKDLTAKLNITNLQVACKDELLHPEFILGVYIAYIKNPKNVD